MDLTLIEKGKGVVTFGTKGVEVHYLNLMRRYITSAVPIMAIEDVEFRKNSSILYDEIVAHRLGLIPLKTDLKGYTLPSECTCDGAGCAKCQVSITLKAKGPGIITAESMNSADPAIKPIFPEMPIVKLLKGQDIEFEAKACLGQGFDHAKFCGALCSYHHKDVVEGKKLEVPARIEFVFTIESFGQLRPQDLVSAAADRLKQDAKAFQGKLKEADAGVPESGQMGTVED
jgi:DNA-directed RNA polymerase subunit D